MTVVVEVETFNHGEVSKRNIGTFVDGDCYKMDYVYIVKCC